MSNDKPRVSIGMPVFNGEKYLKEAVDSILAQTYRDFELIISDNASTDHTQQICLEYVAKDSRIRYYRNEKNLGADKNFNRVFELSSGEYFKWAAYDDVHAPEYLQKCIAILDKDPSIVLCHSRTGRIDEHGTLADIYNQRMLRIGSRKPHERFSDLIRLFYNCYLIFGVIRASSFRKTPLHGNYIGADRNLLAEIGLMGRIHEIPECLFFERYHPDSYTATRPWPYTSTTPVNILRKEMAWWSKHEWTSFPHWKNCVEYFKSVNRVSLKWSERLLCYNQLFRWFMEEGWLFMFNDMEIFLLRNSRFARKVIPFVLMNLKRTVIPIIKKMVGTAIPIIKNV